MLHFFCAVTGMRISEAVAVEIDKHMTPDCSIVYVRQQRVKSVNRIKEHLDQRSTQVTLSGTASARFSRRWAGLK